MPATTRGLPSISPRTKIGKVFWLTSELKASTKPTVAFLSASGNAPKMGSIAPAPKPLSLATALCVAGLAEFEVDRISVTRRSARKFVKKPIQPFRWESFPRKSRPAVRFLGKYGIGCRIKDRTYRAQTPAPHAKRAPEDYAIFAPPACQRPHMSDNPKTATLRAALDRYVDPYLGETFGNAGAVREVSARDNGYWASIALGFPVGGYHAELAAALEQYL